MLVRIVVAPGRQSCNFFCAARVNLFGVRPLQVQSPPSQRDCHLSSSRSDTSPAGLAGPKAARVAIEKIEPQVDGGRFAAKAVAGQELIVSADIFSDGQDTLRAAICYRAAGERKWREAPMAHYDNDRWRGPIVLDAVGPWEFRVLAWRDVLESWRVEVRKKLAAGQTVALEILEGVEKLRTTADGASGKGASAFRLLLEQVDHASEADRLTLLLSDELGELNLAAGPRAFLSESEPLSVFADRKAAAFAAWYEMFPRSQSGDPKRHGNFDDVIRRLPYVRDLGFDVLYFTPIHPIGRTNRKGRNNALKAKPGEPGSVYAIGSEEGGHTAIHPELGTLEDFRRLVQEAETHGLEIALDIAIQASPDHPWLKDHPEWFEWRPDGTIRFAENPPKKYEDIVNVSLYGGGFPNAWEELRNVFEFWIAQGVKTFRVDNPHTKPYPFWEWVIGDIKARHPEAVLLSEAFTRPKPMKYLAKLGFTQSYTYFTWRHGKQEFIDYLTELTRTEAKDFLRPNFFVNTPDINPPILHSGSRGAHIQRLVLAATLSSLWGMYNGFEVCEAAPLPGKHEEYLDSEKYQLRAWDFDRPGNIKDVIRQVNTIRRENPAMHTHLNVRFLNAWNDQILYFVKMTPAKDNAILVAVNLDVNNPQECDFEVPLWEFGLPDHAAINVEDLFSGRRFSWTGKIQRMRLDPIFPVAIWRITPPSFAADRR
jgi:starch synthase (maltosyl-transferring)